MNIQTSKGTIELKTTKNITFKLLGYSDAEFVGCLSERKSVSAMCYFLEIV